MRPSALRSTLAFLLLLASAAGGEASEAPARAPERVEVSGHVVTRSGAPVATTIVIVGTVTAADGRPLAGASVEADAASAVTDDAGAFCLQIATGHGKIHVEYPGLGSVDRQVEVAPDGAPVHIVFPPRAAVAGRVVTLTGTPVAKTPVELRPLAGPPGEGVMEVATDSAGRFRFEGQDYGRYEIAAMPRGPGRPLAVREIQVDGAVEDLELAVAQLGQITGRISGVRREDLTALVLVAFNSPAVLRGTVAEDGTYRFADVGAGDWLITAETREGGHRAQGRVALAAGGSAQLDLQMGGGIKVSGRVRVNGQPLAGGQVLLRGEREFVPLGANLDDRAEFRLDGLAEGRYSLSISARDLEFRETIDLGADRFLDLDIAAGVLSGVVVDGATGLPLADAEVRLEPVLEGRVTRSDALGQFSFGRVVTGIQKVIATRRAYSMKRLEVQMTAAGAQVTMSLLPAAPHLRKP